MALRCILKSVKQTPNGRKTLAVISAFEKAYQKNHLDARLAWANPYFKKQNRTSTIQTNLGMLLCLNKRAFEVFLGMPHLSCGEGIHPGLLVETSKQGFSEIVKSEMDKRSYLGFELPNHMRVLIVSDPTTDKSAACLALKAGSMLDPPELPGLAHFCEHMLFLGSSKYPSENTYSKFILDHGGQCNASTLPDKTCFFFDIVPQYLDEALDIFADFFVKPLFNDGSVKREVDAIQSEYEKNASSDLRRLFQLERSLSDPKHDYSKFLAGNRFSLVDSEIARSVNLKEQLFEYHQKWYSANLMALTVLGKEDISTLKEMIMRKFDSVLDYGTAQPVWFDTPWPESCLKKYVCMYPLKNINQLHIIWPTPDYSDEYLSQPASYITHLLGHESQGSILSALKRRKWANSLSCGQNHPADGIAYLILSLELSNEGLDNVDTVIKIIYQYINILRGQVPQHWIFDELQALKMLYFRFKDKERPYDYVVTLSSNLHRYKLRDVLTGPYLLSEFKPAMITDVLEHLSPDNSRIFIMSKKFQSQCQQLESWYGTKYLCMDIPQSMLLEWRNPGTSPELHLPAPNIYISTNFAMAKRLTPPVSEVPTILYQSDMCRLWFLQDLTYNLPKAFITFHIMSPVTYQDPSQTLMAAIYVDILVDYLQEDYYNCVLAGLTIDLRHTTQGLKLSFSGFTEKLLSIIRKTMHEIAHYTQPDSDRFDCVLEEIQRTIHNFKMKPPYQQSSIYLTNLVSDRSWINDDFMTVLPEINHNRFCRFITDFFSHVFIEVLAYGNLTSYDAFDCVSFAERILVESLGTKAVLSSQLMMGREVMLPDDSNFRYSRMIDDHCASALTYYLQCDKQSTISDATLNLFRQIVYEPMFAALRTEQQLGYIVSPSVRRSNTLQGFRVVIQSTMPLTQVEIAIEEFLVKFRDVLVAMKENEYRTHVNSLKTNLLEVPQGMAELNARLWLEIACRHYNFERHKLEAKALDNIQLEDLIRFFDLYIAPNSPNRRKLSVHISSTAAKLKGGFHPPIDLKCIKVEDHMYLKRVCPLSPLAEPFIPLTETTHTVQPEKL